MVVQLTDACVEAIEQRIIGNNNKGFRITVDIGGCSGLMYDFDIVKKDGFQDNELFYIKGVCIIVDVIAQKYLQDRTLNYKVELGQEFFEVIQPKGVSNCGCGKSFSI